MGYLKYIQYFYLFAAGFFLYQGIASMNQPERNSGIMFLFAALAFFMFLFRRHFYRKYNNNKRK